MLKKALKEIFFFFHHSVQLLDFHIKNRVYLSHNSSAVIVHRNIYNQCTPALCCLSLALATVHSFFITPFAEGKHWKLLTSELMSFYITFLILYRHKNSTIMLSSYRYNNSYSLIISVIKTAVMMLIIIILINCELFAQKYLTQPIKLANKSLWELAKFKKALINRNQHEIIFG